jgi:hypothetical protein
MLCEINIGTRDGTRELGGGGRGDAKAHVQNIMIRRKNTVTIRDCIKNESEEALFQNNPKLKLNCCHHHH